MRIQLRLGPIRLPYCFSFLSDDTLSHRTLTSLFSLLQSANFFAALDDSGDEAPKPAAAAKKDSGAAAAAKKMTTTNAKKVVVEPSKVDEK